MILLIICLLYTSPSPRDRVLSRMPSNIKVLQVIPKLGYGGAETGCYDIAHYLPENGCESFIVTSGGELTKFVDKKK